jgi:predicted transcriptional regulator
MKSGLPQSSSQMSSDSSTIRRNTVDIYADILEVVKSHGGRGRITRLSYGCGMPVDRLKKSLDKMQKYGLVRGNPIETDDSGSATAFIITARGQEFLDIYWRMKGFLETFAEGGN